MKFNIKSKTMLIDSRIENIINKKIGSLAKIIPHNEIIPVDVTIERNQHHQKGDVYLVAVQFLLKGKKIIRAEEQEETLRQAILEVKDELEVQIKKYDDRGEERRKKSIKIDIE